MTIRDLYTDEVDKNLGDVLILLTILFSVYLYFLLSLFLVKVMRKLTPRLGILLFDPNNSLYAWAELRFGERKAHYIDYTRIAILSAIGVTLFLVPPLLLSVRLLEGLFGFSHGDVFTASNAYSYLVNAFLSRGLSLTWAKLWSIVVGIGDLVGGVQGILFFKVILYKLINKINKHLN